MLLDLKILIIEIKSSKIAETGWDPLPDWWYSEATNKRRREWQWLSTDGSSSYVASFSQDVWSKNYMGQLKFLWTQKEQTNNKIDIDTSDEISPWTDETECVVANW